MSEPHPCIPHCRDFGCGDPSNPDCMLRPMTTPISPEDLAAQLPDSPEDYLTDEQKAKFAAGSERNRLRKARIAMETGVPFNEIG